MNEFFSLGYWFTMSPPEVGGLLGNVVFALFIIVLVLGIVGRIVSDRKQEDRYKRDIGNRIASLLVTMGILGLILYFFSFEGIQLFGARFWYPVWVVTVIVWAFYIFRYVKRDIPQHKAQAEARREQGKYLPQPKKKKKR